MRQKDFCNTIGTFETCRRPVTMSAVEGIVLQNSKMVAAFFPRKEKPSENRQSICPQARYRSCRWVHHLLLWSPARLFDRRAHSPENLSPVIQKEFCNTIEGRTDMPLKRAHLHRFSQLSDTNWLMCKPNDRRVRVSRCTWLTLELWPMTAPRQKGTLDVGEIFIRHVQSIGIRDRPTSLRVHPGKTRTQNG